MPQKKSLPKPTQKALAKSIATKKPTSNAKVRVSSGRKNTSKSFVASLFTGGKKWATMAAIFIIFGWLGAYYIQYSSAVVDCATVTLRYRDTNSTRYGCVSVLQNYLKTRGFYSLTVDGSFGASTANAVLNFQRSQKLTDDAIVGPMTWRRLKTPLAMTYTVPSGCKTTGTVICVSKAQRKLRMYKSGTLVKEINVRVGGWTTDKYGNYRVHHTVSGTYSVYNKDPNPSSVRYGEGAMPWSVMFDPNMYVHYSDDFRIYGYARASHGCVNVGNYDNAKWIYDNTPLWSKVIVY